MFTSINHIKNSILAVLTVIIFLYSNQCFGQHEYDWWCFGSEANVQFQKDSLWTDSVHTSINTIEGVSSISHPVTGELLFYTDGITVWGNDHVPMPNGFSLGGHSSSSQSALIIPIPEDRHRYYIFSIDDGVLSKGSKGLSYSIVDMRLNLGKGDVDFRSKNIKIRIPAAERMTATKHATLNAYWLVTQGYQDNRYFSYLVSANGISSPVISAGGPSNRAPYSPGEVHLGTMKINVQGNQLATCLTGADQLVLLDFNNVTGQVSNGRSTKILLPYGVEFSPDGKLLYVSSNNKIYQFETGKSFPRTSNYLVYQNYLTVFATLQLGKDQQIYVAPLSYNHLSTIRFPNKKGRACGFDYKAHMLDSFTNCWAGLPNMVNSLVSPIDFKIWNNCQKRYTYVSVKDSTYYDSIRFDFGDPASGSANYSTNMLDSHYYKAAGKYQIAGIIYYRINGGYVADTLRDSIEILDMPDVDLGNDTAFCRGPIFTLKAGNRLNKYLWNDGLTSGKRWIKKGGLYTVEVYNKCGSAKDSILIHIDDTIKNALGPDTLFCANDTFQLNPTLDFRDLLWSTGDTSKKISITKKGKLWLRVKNTCNEFSDTINIDAVPFPINYFKKDTVLCKGDTAVIGNSANATSFKWNTGATTAHIKISKTGFYSVKAKNSCGTDHDSIYVYFDELPQYPMADTVLCKGTSFSRSIHIPYTTKYKWNTGSTDSVISINEEGDYSITITNVCGTGTETFTVRERWFPNFDLGPDASICSGERMVLTPDLNKKLLDYTDVTWMDKKHKYQYQVKNTGRYWVEVKNICGVQRDSITVTKRENPEADLQDEYQICEQDLIMDLSNYKYSLYWSNGDTSQTLHIPEPGMYWVEYQNVYGCKGKSEFEVIRCPTPFYAPNAFTPNGDGRNDEFKVVMQKMEEFEMMILNRWNEKMFFTTDINVGWTGKNEKNGTECPVGTYVYRVVYKSQGDNQRHIVHGNVQLVR